MTHVRALFLGNSYTHCNEMPSMVAQLAASAGHALTFEMIAPGGLTLEQHSQNPESLAAIRAGGWDFVVLQEQSTRPVEDAERMETAGAALHAEIAATGGQTVLYMTWARQHLPEMMPKLAEVYTRLARRLDARVAPVGLAWQKALATDLTLVLHTEDHSHPTAVGSYLAACVFYATFFDQNPFGLTASLTDAEGGKLLALPDTHARFLQYIAWETVANYRTSAIKEK